jgi:ABC-type branched-subunit amino acid transport system ATPase component
MSEMSGLGLMNDTLRGRAAVSVRDVKAGYKSRPVFESISLDVPAGQILGIFGHNGAGKSTLLRVIVGMVATQTGTVSLGGQDVTRHGAGQRCRSSIALVPEAGRGVFDDLSVAQNLALAESVACSDGLVLTDSSIPGKFGQLETVLQKLMGRPAGRLSGGERQLVALTMAMFRRPKVLLLDEPSTGLSPSATAEVFGAVREFATRSHGTVLLVEQEIAAALRIVDRVCVIQNGRIVLDVPTEHCPPADKLIELF